MPKSKVRKKSVYTPPQGTLQSATASARAVQPSPRWYAPLMVALMLLGLLWIVVFYLMGSDGPVPGIGAWNLAAGFALIRVGFAMTTRWR